MQAAIRERMDKLPRSSEGNGSECAYARTTELLLDGCIIRTISGEDAQALSAFTNLANLTLNQTTLTSLQNLPPLKSLRTLEVTDNHISSGLEHIASAYPGLKRLQLGGNHIKSIEDLQPLSALSQLEQLGLDLNPVCSMPDYRARMFALIPSLILLDGLDKSGKEVELDSDDEEEEEEEVTDQTLKNFYEGTIEDDEEDEEEFEPLDEAEEHTEEDVDDDDDDEGDDDDNEGPPEVQESDDALKRKGDADMSAGGDAKAARLN